MYRKIVESKVKATWKRVNAGDIDAAVSLATDDLRFTFVGTTPLSATLVGRDAFGAWFENVRRLIPGLRFEVLDVAVSGMPWRTRVATRLRVTSAEFGPEPYLNFMSQWLTLSWGKMTDDWILEDTATLNAALELHSA